ncbi:MAG: hypothetical protein KF699_07570 [Phycisphaeraceae bacterium]|nr:hypothetical protein [Phycisphaeraceae bacterium]MBX3405212.1 hypothetical protein [Phycisphaeraceae bacterium]
MTLRSVVRDGLIVVNTHGEIPDGTPVVILRDDKPRRTGKKAKSAKQATTKKKARSAARKPLRELAAFGMWKNRPEWKGKSSAEIARELREKALGHRSGTR